MTALSDLLTHETIALDQEAEDWQDAIRLAGGLLESAGVSGPESAGSDPGSGVPEPPLAAKISPPRGAPTPPPPPTG